MRITNLKLITSIAIAVLVFLSAPAFAENKRIMVFGDSNSWGWKPVSEIIPTTRYSRDIRWPGVLAKELGENFVVINESLSARTAASDDDSLGVSGAGLNGLKYLPAALASNMPLDLVIIMLGTNDTKPYLNRTTFEIGLDIMKLVAEVKKNTGVATAYKPAKVLVVVPPALGKIADVDWLQSIFPEASITKSKELAGILCPMAVAVKVACFDAGSVAAITGIDGVHLTVEHHQKLGIAVASQVSRIIE